MAAPLYSVANTSTCKENPRGKHCLAPLLEEIVPIYIIVKSKALSPLPKINCKGDFPIG